MKTSAPRAAIVTASYGPDLERCRLLCETMDRHVSGYSKHVILVEPRDVHAFRALQGPRREIVDERDLLPGWLVRMDDPFSLFRRRLWVSLRTMPLRGWHVQQLRRIAIAAHLEDDCLVYCDSDVAFLRDFDCGDFWQDGRLRMLRRDGGLPLSGEHPVWSRNAGELLGIEGPPSSHDYIGTVIAWRRATVLAMMRRIEQVSGRSWVAAVGGSRRFSECMIYGRYVDEVTDGEGHVASARELCRVAWNPRADGRLDLEDFVAGTAPDQVAVGFQSFIGIDTASIRSALRAA